MPGSEERYLKGILSSSAPRLFLGAGSTGPFETILEQYGDRAEATEEENIMNRDETVINLELT